MGRKRHDSPI